MSNRDETVTDRGLQSKSYRVNLGMIQFLINLFFKAETVYACAYIEEQNLEQS